MKHSLKTVAESLQAQLVGNGAVEVSGIASIREATAGDLVFVEDENIFAPPWIPALLL